MRPFVNDKDVVNQLAEAMNSGEEAKIQEAWKNFHESIAATVRSDFEEIKESNDSAVLAKRGYRQLTSTEKQWYQKVITALKSKDPKQAFTAILDSDLEEDLMPTTIIEDVYRDLRDEHPLLQAINFQYVGYITKWILNDHTAQTAVWGQITAEIVKEITSTFRSVNIDQHKLSAYAVIENGMLDLGPTFLDGYIRACLAEAIMCGLEQAIVKGTGVDQPVGLIKDVHIGVSVSETTGYPDKAQIAVKSFTPAEYGALLAQMSKTEKGKKRKFTEVGLICNQTDYLTKVMPATTAQNVNGQYVRDLFPFPTTVYISNELEDGEAVLFLKGEYFCGMGGSKNGVIEYSDEYKFLEDQRVFKIKQYGAGRATDNTCALYLDITNLDPAYITVKHIDDVPSA